MGETRLSVASFHVDRDHLLSSAHLLAGTTAARLYWRGGAFEGEQVRQHCDVEGSVWYVVWGGGGGGERGRKGEGGREREGGGEEEEGDK